MFNYFSKEKYFYHSSIRRYTALFGSLFSNLYISRTDGKKVNYIKVPIRHGRYSPYMEVQDKVTRETKKIRNVLPALTFQLENIELDNNRKENRHLPIQRTLPNENGTINVQMNRVPYNIYYSLTINTNKLDDAFQILEQIIPTFNPDVKLKVKDIDNSEVDYNQTIPVKLESVSGIDDSFDNMDDSSRIITITLSFVLEGYLYGRTVEHDVIERIVIDSWLESPEGKQMMGEVDVNKSDKPYQKEIMTTVEYNNQINNKLGEADG